MNPSLFGFNSTNPPLANNGFLQPFAFDNFNASFQNMMLPNNISNMYSMPFMPNTPPILPPSNAVHENSLFTPNLHPFLNNNQVNASPEKSILESSSLLSTPPLKPAASPLDAISPPPSAIKSGQSSAVASPPLGLLATTPLNNQSIAAVTSTPNSKPTSSVAALNATSTVAATVATSPAPWPAVVNSHAPTVADKVKESKEVAPEVKPEPPKPAAPAPIQYRYAWCPSTVGKGGVCYNENCQLAHEEKYARCCAPSCNDKVSLTFFEFIILGNWQRTLWIRSSI